MRDLLILSIHLIATLARLMGPGGLRSVVAESLWVKHQPADSQSFPSTRAKPPRVRSDPRRRVCAFHAPGPRHPIGDRAETVDDPGLSSDATQPQVPLAVFTDAPWPAGYCQVNENSADRPPR